MRILPTLTVGLFTMAMMGSGAFADDNLNCEAYGAQAISQHQDNIANSCGFTGGRWSSDYQGHVNWCKSPGVKMANLTTEDRARKAALEQCKKPAIIMPGIVMNSRVDICTEYADNANSHIATNEAYTCNFTGSRWDDNWQGHYDWCLGQTNEITEAETKIREDEANRCIGIRTEERSCAKYVRRAGRRLENHKKYCRTNAAIPSEQELLDFCGRIGADAAFEEHSKITKEARHCRKYPPNEVRIFENPDRKYTLPNDMSKRLPVVFCKASKSRTDCATKYCQWKGYDLAKGYKTKKIKARNGEYSSYWPHGPKALKGSKTVYSKIKCVKV